MPDSKRDTQAPPVNDAAASPTAARKPYRKPAYQSEAVFETTALACGKINSTQFQCRLNTKAS